MRIFMIRAIQLSAFALTIIATSLQAEALQPLWSVDNFKMPESVVYDAKQKRYYVSNVNGGPMTQDGNGSIGWISAQGKKAEPEWIRGLHSPKGLLLDYPYLYVADVQELVVINVESGLISARYEARNSAVLNGITQSQNGQIYVSDWIGNTIYQLAQNELLRWLDSPALQSPNGLFAQGDYLYLGSWGEEIQGDFSTLSSGGLKRIKISDKSIETITQGSEWMNLDGLHLIAGRPALATDFISGELLAINASGAIEKRYPLAPSAADFYYDPKQSLLVVPYLMDNRVVAYRLNR